MSEEREGGTEEADLRMENKKRDNQYKRTRRRRRRKQQRKLLCHSPLFPFPPFSSPSPPHSPFSPPSLPLLCSSPPSLPFTLPPVSLCSSPPSLLPHDQEWMVLSKNCPKIRQKQDLDAKIAIPLNKSSQLNLMMQGLKILMANKQDQCLRLCKQTVSTSLTTTMLFGEKRKAMSYNC